MNVTGSTVVLVDSFSKRTLLLHRKIHWNGWEYVKGSAEHGETAEATARREVLEETGLKISSLHPLDASLTFNVEDHKRTYTAFLGVTNEQKITLGLEHDDARWVTFAEARALLTFPDQLPPLNAAEQLTSQLL